MQFLPASPHPCGAEHHAALLNGRASSAAHPNHPGAPQQSYHGMTFWTPHLHPSFLLGTSHHVPTCRGAALQPCQAPGKGWSRVTAIDISSAGSPSGSDGILEHGNGSCLVEKANLPQLYRISAGVLGSPCCHRPCSKPRSKRGSLKLQQSNLLQGTATTLSPVERWPRGSPVQNLHPVWHHHPKDHAAQMGMAVRVCFLNAERVTCPPVLFPRGVISAGRRRRRRRVRGQCWEGCGPQQCHLQVWVRGKHVLQGKAEANELLAAELALFGTHRCAQGQFAPMGTPGAGGSRRRQGQPRAAQLPALCYMSAWTRLLKAAQPAPAIAACCITMAKSIFLFLWR